MQRKNVNQVVAALTVAAVGVTAWSGVAQASGVGAHGLFRVEESNARVDDAIRIKEKSGGQVIVSRITIAPGGHTPWHYHPGPHIVTVKSGTVKVFETDCTSTTYPVNTGFFDPGDTRHRHIHTLRNASDDVSAEVVITDIRTDDLRPTIAVDRAGPACFS